MSAPAVSRVARHAARSVARSAAGGAQRTVRLQRPALRAGSLRTVYSSPRCFSTSLRSRAGLMPETEDPQPPNIVENDQVLQPTQLNDDEYQLRSDEYMNAIHEKAEEIQEDRAEVEVEYSVCYTHISRVVSGEANTITRRAFSPSPSLQTAHISSTSSRRTSKSGYPRPYQDQSVSTGWWMARACTKRRVADRAIGCI